MPAQEFLSFSKDSFDLIFLDPPYNMGILDEILEKVSAITASGGIIMAESELEWQPKDDIPGLSQVKRFKYGKVAVTKFIKE